MFYDMPLFAKWSRAYDEVSRMLSVEPTFLWEYEGEQECAKNAISWLDGHPDDTVAIIHLVDFGFFVAVFGGSYGTK